MAHAEAVPQQARALVEQQDAEGVVVDQRLDGGRDARQQLVQFEDRRELLRNLREQLEVAVLAGHAAEQSRVVDGHGDAGGDYAQQRAVVLRVGAQAGRLHVDHAHHFAARNHRHGELGADGIDRVEVARILAHVGRKHRLARGRGGSREAFSDPHHQVLDHLVAVAYGVADAQRLRLLLEKQDGEQLVGNHLTDDFGHVGEQAVEVGQGLGGGGGHLEKEVQKLRALAETDGGSGGGHQRAPALPRAAKLRGRGVANCASRSGFRSGM